MITHKPGKNGRNRRGQNFTPTKKILYCTNCDKFFDGVFGDIEGRPPNILVLLLVAIFFSAMLYLLRYLFG